MADRRSSSAFDGPHTRGRACDGRGRRAALPLGLPFLLLLLVALGCASAPPPGGDGATALGQVRVESGPLGPSESTPTTCESGERGLFLGADFLDPAGMTTRVIVAPTGETTLRLFRSQQPLDSGVIFRREECDRFELSLSRTGWQINDVYDLEVALAFDCRKASGEAAAGELAAAHCH